MTATVVGPGGTVEVDNSDAVPIEVTIVGGGGGGGGLTDAELRATPVPVAFPADESGLTDVELRAAPVAVAGTVGVNNFPAGFAVVGEVEVKNDAGNPVPVNGTVAATGPVTNAELRATAPAVKDDYQAGECLAEQTGAAGVLTFTFSSPVQLVHVEGDGVDTDIARVDPFGGVPSATLGFRAADGVGLYLPVTATVVQVWAPVGMVIAVNGFRRT